MHIKQFDPGANEDRLPACHQIIVGVVLEWLAAAERQVRHIMTYNDVGNEHMIAVNAALGHRVTDYFQIFELEVADARTLVTAR